MLNLYSGTPGSGKGYHMADRIYKVLRHTRLNIICTCPIDLDTLALTRLGWVKKRVHDRFGINFRNYNKVKLKGNFYYWNYNQMTVENLLLFAQRNHEENHPVDKYQTLVLIDEGGLVFNCRDFGAKERAAWIKFFPVHRHCGYEIVVACQFDRQIDRQIRNCVEMEYRHRDLTVLPFLNFLRLFHWRIFLCFGYWYSTRQGNKLSTDLFFFRPRIGAIYNTLANLYDEMSIVGNALPPGCVDVGGDTGAPPAAAHWAVCDTLVDIIVRVRTAVKKYVTQWRSGASVPAEGDCVTNQSTVSLDKLFGRDIDATKSIEEQEHTSEDA